MHIIILAILLLLPTVAAAFDMGFDFRATAGLVTDPNYGVPVLGELYPNTYTNANGDSINAGWSSAPSTFDDGAPGNDVRIQGINYQSNASGPISFQVDLSSGSAPGAGTYNVDLALGMFFFAQLQDFKLFDNTTLLIDGTNGGAGFATASNHFIDATLTDILGGATWLGTQVSKTFATTTPKVTIAVDSLALNTTLSHFRLTLVSAGGAVIPQRTLTGVGT